MSSGHIVIQLSEFSYIDGEFKNGKLVTGTYQTKDARYFGKFGDNTLLHGLGDMVYNGRVYKGTFRNGLFISGKETINDINTSEGIYAHKLGSLPVLIDGVKKIDGVRYEGKFHNGDLINGSVTYPNSTVMSGMWQHDVMKDGVVYNCNLGFKARYKIRRNSSLNKDLLNVCTVDFKYDVARLPKELLLLYACRGNNCANLHSIYNGHLAEMQGHMVDYLLKNKSNIKSQLTKYELPIFDELVANLSTNTNLSTNVDLDVPSEIESNNTNSMFDTYYSSHD